MKKDAVVRWRCTSFERSLVEQIANKLKMGQAEAMRQLVRREAVRPELFPDMMSVLPGEKDKPDEYANS